PGSPRHRRKGPRSEGIGLRPSGRVGLTPTKVRGRAEQGRPRTRSPTCPSERPTFTRPGRDRPPRRADPAPCATPRGLLPCPPPARGRDDVPPRLELPTAGDRVSPSAAFPFPDQGPKVLAAEPLGGRTAGDLHLVPGAVELRDLVAVSFRSWAT